MLLEHQGKSPTAERKFSIRLQFPQNFDSTPRMLYAITLLSYSLSPQ